MKVQVWGGPHDGAFVPYYGPRMVMPRRTKPLVGYIEPDKLPENDPIKVDNYKLVYGDDGEMYYVAA